jgi:hypothetical protein
MAARKAKVAAIAKKGATAGERKAAKAALKRMSGRKAMKGRKSAKSGRRGLSSARSSRKSSATPPWLNSQH